MKTLLLLVMAWMGSFAFAEEPGWVKAPDKNCKSSQLCAVGVGDGRSLAEADARSGIAKIFETKIKATFTQNTSSNNNDVSTNMSEEIMEEVNQSIEGIEIKDTYESKTEFFALAILDKNKASLGFRTKIKELDDKIKTFIADNSAKSIRLAGKHLQTREQLNYRLQFLSGSGIPAPVSYDEIFKKKKASTAGVILAIKIEAPEPNEIEALVTTLLSEMGYKVVKSEGETATHTVSGKFTSEKQFLNVEGFEKHKFVLHIIAANKKGEKSGSIDYSLVRTGRDYVQALENSLPLFRDYLNENLAGLNIE
ncbi:MAG: hypothetical protein A2504_02985 [Bdellovibrionales bacterium RIFOXYD12_FULL_39_22]|nr:MAG: hypothetical protein A2385_05700 [Bdellovibrionales bacterium RIFOXYB1_FULL_39_21]OFZ42247.1 MAG: hypothetical protein A2485_15730 [Bdellovibrionales bacterium RIFOXYC12_FULL_39_17]OFZ46661.1 MAG: hypothetical protein A2404_03940 [Bdellovibrionales bacterium RIFOXYC1_FULL_39_130]OFZ75415.1 MAG: hypothetical protein A2451_09040 [Bdellovibrionales bacterium RIFOXYC2_FULL_39_8]OFZ76062.1 MAG: hypothetical protein A2560_03210 [Bdellovibrionales bacterium RIFOXYD1_FULL_39_84]OFZ93046.1 MAG: